MTRISPTQNVTELIFQPGDYDNTDSVIIACSLLQQLCQDSAYRGECISVTCFLQAHPPLHHLSLSQSSSFASYLLLFISDYSNTFASEKRWREKYAWQRERGDPGERLLKRADIPPVSITVTSLNQGRNKFSEQSIGSIFKRSYRKFVQNFKKNCFKKVYIFSRRG
jgi:hypothetical protein